MLADGPGRSLLAAPDPPAARVDVGWLASAIAPSLMRPLFQPSRPPTRAVATTAIVAATACRRSQAAAAAPDGLPVARGVHRVDAALEAGAASGAVAGWSFEGDASTGSDPWPVCEGATVSSCARSSSNIVWAPPTAGGSSGRDPDPWAVTSVAACSAVRRDGVIRVTG